MTTTHDAAEASGATQAQDEAPTGDPAAARDWRAGLRASRWGTPLVLLVTLLLVMGGAYLVKVPGKAEGPAVDAADPAAGKISTVQLKGGVSGPAPEVGKPAPDFTASTWDGKPVTLSAYRGRPVWLTFGASWCASCRAEFPDVQAAHSAAKPDGLAVIGVSLSEGAPAVKEYAGRLGLTFPQIPDPDTKVASAYRVMGVPAHVFIDRAGIVRSIDMGILGHADLADRLVRIGA